MKHSLGNALRTRSEYTFTSRLSQEFVRSQLFSAASRSSTDETKDQVEGDDTTIVEPEQGNGADIPFFLPNPLLTSLQSSLTSFPSCGPAQTSPVSPCRPSSSKNDPCWRELQSWWSTAHLYTVSLTCLAASWPTPIPSYRCQRSMTPSKDSCPSSSFT